MEHNIFENEPEKKSLLNEPYKAVLESKSGGVKIVVTAEVDSDLGAAEAERRARVIVDHFKLVIGSV